MSGWSSAIEIEMQHVAQPRLVAVLSLIRAAAADFSAACNALLATLTTSLCALPYFTTFHLIGPTPALLAQDRPGLSRRRRGRSGNCGPE
jgi:hypothetical protein